MLLHPCHSLCWLFYSLNQISTIRSPLNLWYIEILSSATALFPTKWSLFHASLFFYSVFLQCFFSVHEILYANHLCHFICNPNQQQLQLDTSPAEHVLKCSQFWDWIVITLLWNRYKTQFVIKDWNVNLKSFCFSSKCYCVNNVTVLPVLHRVDTDWDYIWRQIIQA